MDSFFPTRFNKPAAPTLGVLSEAYGEDTTENWMIQQVQFLNECIGVKVKLNEFQIRAVSNSLIDKFSDGADRLNIREILLFFSKLIGGEYGHFYGVISPDVIGEAAEQFLQWRHEERARIEREQEMEERRRYYDEMDRNAVPPPPGTLGKIVSALSSIGHTEKKDQMKTIDKDHITKFNPMSREELERRRINEARFQAMLQNTRK